MKTAIIAVIKARTEKGKWFDMDKYGVETLPNKISFFPEMVYYLEFYLFFQYLYQLILLILILKGHVLT